MSLLLSRADRRRLDACIQTLLSPLDEEDAVAWPLAVNRSIRTLLGTETAIFVDIAQDGPAFHSEEFSPEILAQFASFSLADEGTERGKAMASETITQSQIVGGDWAGYHADPMVQAFYKPHRLLDTTGYVIQWEDGTGVVLETHVSEAHSPRCGPEALAKLDLLLPAAKAGFRSAQRLRAKRYAMGAMLDQLREALVVYDARGRVQHENTEFRRILALEPSPLRVRSEIDRLVRSTAVVTRGGMPRVQLSALHVSTETVRYRLRPILVGRHLLLPGTSILVAIERLTPEPLSRGELMDRFGFTAREAQVAVLVAQGASNKAIAAKLGISLHTARHHTERILTKLELTSRAGVASRLAEPQVREF